MYDVRTNLSNQVVDNVKSNLDVKIYETLIPRNIRLAEAPSHGLPINLYDAKSAGTESYRLLAKGGYGKRGYINGSKKRRIGEKDLIPLLPIRLAQGELRQ